MSRVQIYLHHRGGCIDQACVRRPSHFDSLIGAEGREVPFSITGNNLELNKFFPFPIFGKRTAGEWWIVVEVDTGVACEVMNWLFSVADWTVTEGKSSLCKMVAEGEELTEEVFG